MIAGHLITWAARSTARAPRWCLVNNFGSYAEIRTRSNRFAQAALALGLQPGERLAVLLDNSVESLDSLWRRKGRPGLRGPECPPHAGPNTWTSWPMPRPARCWWGRPSVTWRGLRQAAGRRLPSCACAGPGCGRRPGVTDWPPPSSAAPDRGASHRDRARPPDAHRLRQRHHRPPKGAYYTLERWRARLTNSLPGDGIRPCRWTTPCCMSAADPCRPAFICSPCFLRGARNVASSWTVSTRDVGAAIERTASRIDAGPRCGTGSSTRSRRREGDWSSVQRIHHSTAPTPVSLDPPRPGGIINPILRQQYSMTEAVQPLCVLYPHGCRATAPRRPDRLLAG